MRVYVEVCESLECVLRVRGMMRRMACNRTKEADVHFEEIHAHVEIKRDVVLHPRHRLGELCFVPQHRLASRKLQKCNLEESDRMRRREGGAKRTSVDNESMSVMATPRYLEPADHTGAPRQTSAAVNDGGGSNGVVMVVAVKLVVVKLVVVVVVVEMVEVTVVMVMVVMVVVSW